MVGPNKPVHILVPFENRGKETFYIEALEFPSTSFTGLISFSVSLVEMSHDQVCRRDSKDPLGSEEESHSARQDTAQLGDVTESSARQ